ncbi:MAG: hypothetical protein ACKOX2_15455 [Microcystaceae cyanobacterium]
MESRKHNLGGDRRNAIYSGFLMDWVGHFIHVLATGPLGVNGGHCDFSLGNLAILRDWQDNTYTLVFGVLVLL